MAASVAASTLTSETGPPHVRHPITQSPSLTPPFWHLQVVWCRSIPSLSQLALRGQVHQQRWAVAAAGCCCSFRAGGRVQPTAMPSTPHSLLPWWVGCTYAATLANAASNPSCSKSVQHTVHPSLSVCAAPSLEPISHWKQHYGRRGKQHEPLLTPTASKPACLPPSQPASHPA